MSIAVQYSNSADREAAEKLAEGLNTKDQNPYDVKSIQSETIDYSNYQGVIIVGGHNANPLYAEWMEKKVFPKLECGTNERDFFDFDNTVTGGVVTESIGKDDTIIQGLAGCTEEQTFALVEWYLGEAVEQQFALNFTGAAFDDFIERINDRQQSGEGDEVTDPTDPILDDRDPDAGKEPDIPALTKEVFVEGVNIGIPDSEQYSFTVEGWSKEIDSKFGMETSGTAYLDVTYDGKTGGGDVDKFLLSESATISDFSAPRDKILTIGGRTGTSYKYNSDKDKFEENQTILTSYDEDNADVIEDDEKTKETNDSETEKDQEKDEGFFESIVDAFNNPFETENAVQIVLVLTLGYYITQALQLGEGLVE